MKCIILSMLLVIASIIGTSAHSFWAINSNSPIPDYTCEGNEATCQLKYMIPSTTVVSTEPLFYQVPSTFRIIGDYYYDL